VTHHPRATLNRWSTYAGIACALVTVVHSFRQPDNWRLWGAYLVGAAFFLQLDGLKQVMEQIVAGIRARFGGNGSNSV